MAREGFEKWDDYKIGEIPWLNARREHPSRDFFVNWVDMHKVESIIEIGAGECIEAQEIRKRHPKMKYTIADVSHTFLAHAKRLGFPVVCASMTWLGVHHKADLVYCNAVLEHSPGILETIEAMKAAAPKYFVTMFKWGMKRGSMRPVYIEKRKYFSTSYSVDNVIDLFNPNGSVIISDDGAIVDWKKYRAAYKGTTKHRNGSYLSFWGEW